MLLQLRAFFVARRHTFAIGSLLAVAAMVAFRWVHEPIAYWAIDDAGITYVAAFQLADHGSLAPYLEGPPIEGYSNPLLFFTVVVLRLVNAFDPITTHIKLEMIVFAAMIVLVWRLARRVTGELPGLVAAVAFAALELLVPATWMWYGSGLENVWLSAGIIALVWLCVRTSQGVPLHPAWGALVFAVAIIRPEGPVHAIAFYFALAVFARPPELPLRRLARAALVTFVLYALFLLWRRIAYHAWWPNPYYAKLHAGPNVAENLRDYVFGKLWSYADTTLFAASLLGLLVVRELERLALCLLAFVVAALVMPITGGPDWMGEHRFATVLFALCHLSYAIFLARCIVQLGLRVRPIAIAVVAFAVPLLLLYGPLSVHDAPSPNGITIARLARSNGALRWIDQTRVGVPYPVVITPDAGGAVLVGAMQTIDNGFLTDFQLPRIGWDLGNVMSVDSRVFAQITRERRPDLIDDNPLWPLDGKALVTQYARNREGHTFYVRKDHVAVETLDTGAEIVLDRGDVKVYLSPETVRVAAPGALIRCELIVTWTNISLDDKLHLHATTPSDSDDLPLVPYIKGDNGSERRALLIGAPNSRGSIAISLELRDGERVTRGRPIVIDVTDNPFAFARAAAVAAGTPLTVARRIAWLREQMIPRLPMHALRDLDVALAGAAQRNERVVSDYIGMLRWTVRLATLESLPASIRAAEQGAIERVLGACPQQHRVLCLGRAVDDLRRLGYLRVLARAPSYARELRVDPDAPLASRYEALVGVTLADPSDLNRQEQLLRTRYELAKTSSLPPL